MPPFAHLPMARRRTMRTVLLVNGAIMATTGSVTMVALTVACLATEGPSALLMWRFYALNLSISPLITGGIWALRCGARMPKE
jgi:hypothetical protein